MGTIIKANCKCGYQTKDLYFGAGMSNFTKVAMVPAFKNESFDIEMINIKEREKFANYVFYTDAILSKHSDNDRTIDHFDLKLQVENNFCPACKNYNLKFYNIALFD